MPGLPVMQLANVLEATGKRDGLAIVLLARKARSVFQ